MRDRTEIEAESEHTRNIWGHKLPQGRLLELQLEVLLDIRDLLEIGLDVSKEHLETKIKIVPPGPIQ